MPKKKKQSKLKQTLAWFKPTSLKKGALLFAIAFAVIGGGIVAYRSHAQSWTVMANDFIKLTNGAYKSTDCNGNKGCVATVKFPAGAAGANAKIYINFPSSRGVFLCVTARTQIKTPTTGYSLLTMWASIQDPGYARYSIGLPISNWKIYQSNTYAEQCGVVTVPAGSHFLYAELGTSGITGTYPETYVSNVTLKW